MGNQPAVEILIAHYNEDLSWLEGNQDICAIYSKGGAKNAPPYPYQALENIGREGHTYLHHIIERYHSLADITVFLQGRIDDHCPWTLDEIKERSLKTLPGEVTTFPYRELELFDHWDGIPWEEYPSWAKWADHSDDKGKLMKKTPAEYWQTFFPGKPVPASIAYAPGALFAVHKDTIRQHPRELYQLMMKEYFLGDMIHINPETGHLAERFIMAIWNPSEYLCWDSIKDRAPEERNRHGQLARGRWHVVPRWVEVDEMALPPSERSSAKKVLLPTPPSSSMELDKDALLTGARQIQEHTPPASDDEAVHVEVKKNT